MKILVYDNLNIGRLGAQVDKVYRCLAEGDFQTADVKKMSNGYYRAKLDDTNRLLFKIARYEGETYILVLEVIHNHAYEKSKFLRGSKLDEHKLSALKSVNELPDAEIEMINYINPRKQSFHLLDKILSFDDIQEEILGLPVPGIIIGSAGSGKTALTLEKLKLLSGRILYTTLSPYLVENASHIYSSFNYENANQEVSFLSFYEYLSGIAMPKGKEADFTSFERWIARYTQSHKIKDAYRIFEEIKGVLTGSVVDKAYLSLQEYLALGVKQSIFSVAERPQVYDLFIKYLDWIATEDYFDSNITAYHLLEKIKPVYDYVVIDEVQDLTNIQLTFILKALHKPGNFVLCGDANQIVHPNFFSWSQVKTLFYKQDLKANIIRVLATNYRNTPEVTAIANQLLLIKNARFGSIDKESSYLVVPNSNQNGQVEYLENTSQTNKDLNSKTNLSTKFAVLVLRNEDKAAARKFYNTPLLFSIQEAKGLEYENIILYNTISSYESEFRELTNGVSKEDLLPENHNFSRARDKTDKSLEEYKFYVNSLYVGITRAIKNLYMIEAVKKHALLELLGLVDFKQNSSLTDQTSSQDEWKREARRLELQGKQEQADAIREQILHIQPVPWVVSKREDFPALQELALNPEAYNKKAKDRFYHYIGLYNVVKYREPLANLKYRPAERWIQEGGADVNMGHINFYIYDNLKALLPHFLKYGVDYRSEINMTPLICASLSGAIKTTGYLLDNGANIYLTENFGKNALQHAMYGRHLNAKKEPEMLNTHYNRLAPESLKVRISNRLIKINKHQGEYIILNFMLCSLRDQIHVGTTLVDNYDFAELNFKPGFQVNSFLNFFDGLSEEVIPAYRCKPAYISALLSNNELNKEGNGNQKLFVRLKTGIYLPHPLMEILIDEHWVNIYDNIELEHTIDVHDEDQLRYVTLLNQFRQELTADPNAVLDQASYWKSRVSV
jgi:hypothetical protein